MASTLDVMRRTTDPAARQASGMPVRNDGVSPKRSMRRTVRGRGPASGSRIGSEARLRIQTVEVVS